MDLTGSSLPTPLQELSNELTRNAGIRLYIKRDDLIHPYVSGNKWRKLKYSLLAARESGATTLLTFGGAFSNHLYAVAAAGAALEFETIGMVRGEDYALNETHTLQFCRERGMKLHFISREKYRLRTSANFLSELETQFDKPFIIPEGGTSDLALKGVGEMVEEVKNQLGFQPDYFAVAAGTGGTAAGIMAAHADVLAFSALKGGGFLQKDITKLLTDVPDYGRLTFYTDYHFGGYARWNEHLLAFMDKFKEENQIQLEQVYTAKMFYGLFDLIEKGNLTNATIVAVHTGGLQGLLRR
ncbi:1-aminocyclopropane-1-carboxylate deaminase/D-cysteine desulfhydrase [Dyadobacter sandarakinus]|uniref:1-aminocyclopropane-1-carboxylate deaminase/D-cysteine desulfhydrase n=1 Tax=Dyadobacter sandarakinus TaxID=2747268 RepID=UPI001E5DBB42|nr:pyridoxal-phosphate dependent enzyme [Dyadobacter sandarakinus]